MCVCVCVCKLHIALFTSFLFYCNSRSEENFHILFLLIFTNSNSNRNLSSSYTTLCILFWFVMFVLDTDWLSIIIDFDDIVFACVTFPHFIYVLHLVRCWCCIALFDVLHYILVSSCTVDSATYVPVVTGQEWTMLLSI